MWFTSLYADHLYEDGIWECWLQFLRLYARTYICMICSGNGMVGHTTDLLTISTLFLILQLSVSASGRVAICLMLIYIYPKDIFVLILFIVAACRYSLYSKSTYHTPFVNQWGKKSIYFANEKKSRSYA